MDVIKMGIASSNFTEKDLLALKKKIDEGKDKIAEMKGKQKYLLKELAEKWGCKSIEEAEKTLVKTQAELDSISSKLDALLDDIEDKYIDDE